MALHLKFKVLDPVGLYATPTTELVNTVKQFSSHFHLHFERKEVNLKSLMGVLSLGVPTNADLEISIEGPDEQQAYNAIKDKINELKISSIE